MRPVRIQTALVAVAMATAPIGAGPAAVAADLSRYVALGDSWTAGFADAGLSEAGQGAGYPKLLAAQAGAAVSFEQPAMTAPGIPAGLRLRESNALIIEPGTGLGSPVNLTLPRPYDNLAIPGAKVNDLLRTTSDAGGLHDLILRGIGTQIEQALLLEPTFVSLWIGASDVLGAAVSGVVLDPVTLTPSKHFARDYETILTQLIDGGVEAGVVATIPSPDDLPFVNAIRPMLGPVPLIGPEGPLDAGDRVLLTASALIARGDGVPIGHGGTGLPLPDHVILSRAELEQIERRVESYNMSIRKAAAGSGFAVVEVGTLFERWNRAGTSIGAEHFDGKYLSGGLYSADGVHLSALGQALLANEFITAINQVYEAGLAEVGPDTLASLARQTSRTPDLPSRFVFTGRAYKNLRFGLGIPRTGKLLRLKARALRQQRERDLRRRRHYELPPEPRLAVLYRSSVGLS